MDETLSSDARNEAPRSAVGKVLLSGRNGEMARTLHVVNDELHTQSRPNHRHGETQPERRDASGRSADARLNAFQAMAWTTYSIVSACALAEPTPSISNQHERQIRQRCIGRAARCALAAPRDRTNLEVSSSRATIIALEMFALRKPSTKSLRTVDGMQTHDRLQESDRAWEG
eukprot:5276920-Pleurochrysis_carterae.AAC.2